MKLAMLVAVCAVALAGCGGGRSSPHASGSGYGVGVPRTNLMFGKDTYAKGPAMAFRKKVETTVDYRPKQPPKVWTRFPIGHDRQRGF